jgi:hypothetical protein
MAVRIQLRRDTAANWSLNNPSLRPGEVGIETDTLKFKIGPIPQSGSATPWNSITSYANVTPTSLGNSLSDYILAADQGTPGGPAELDANGDLLVPENDIILWNKALYDYTTKITATQPTADRTITLPDATGTVALTSDLNSYAPLSGATFTGNIQVPTAVTFEGATADSYEMTLQATDPTADRTITIPDVNGTIVTTGDTGTVTNTMLANSSITINSFPISLGGSAAFGTDNISEGTTNKYFTDERAQDAAALALSNGTHTNITVTYDDLNNAISLAAAPGYTNEEARDAVAGLITGSTHDGVSVSYTDDGANAGSLAFTNTDKGSSQNIFKNIVVGATTVVADSNNDTLTIVGSNGVGALANATNDVIEIYNTGVTSLTGTANEVEVDTTTGAVIVGLPNNVTISGNLTLSNGPTQASHAATKAYVDNTTAGINFHAPAHAATTSNLTATYDNGTSGVGATLTGSGTFPQIDGHTVAEQERVLVKNQSTGFQNGLYVLTDDGDPSGSWVLTRATDADNSPAGEIAYGDFCFIQNGGQAGYGFIVNTTGTITIGSTNINYVQFNAGQVVVAGNGLTEPTAGTLAIDTSVTVDLSTAQTLTNKTLTSPTITGTGAIAGTFTGNLTGDVTGNVSGNAGTVTNGVYTTSSYADPSWITSLGWSKITSTPTTISGYGITNAVVTNAANTITAASASTKPLIIKGYASQSANLQEWQDSSGNLVGYISPSGSIISYGNGIISGDLRVGTATWLSATLNVKSRTSSEIPAVIRGSASQSANLQEWQNSSGTAIAYINSVGSLVTTDSITASGAVVATNGVYVNTGYIGGAISAKPFLTTIVGLLIRGAVSQTADLAQWQNSSSTVLTKIDASGNITAPSLTLSTTALATTSGGTGLSSYASGDILYASATDTLAKLAKGTNGQILTLASGLPSWADAPITLPSQTGNNGKYLTTDGTTASWATLVVPITTGTATVSSNTVTAIDSFTMTSGATEYMVTLLQGSKRRTSKVLVHSDGSNIDMTEFAIIELGGTMSGVVVSASALGSAGYLNVTVTDAATTNVTVKFSKVAL